MATSKVSYTGTLRTEAVHQKSGAVIITDAPTDNHGKGNAFSPTDLLATSLASCMITVIGIEAEKKGFTFEVADAVVKKTMADNPRRVAGIEVTLNLPDVYSPKEKTIIKRIAETCPVAKSLHPEIEQKITILYV